MSSSPSVPGSVARQRRLPIGAEPVDGGIEFRVWAPQRRRVTLHREDARGRTVSVHPLERDDDGYFSAFVADARAGWRYRFALDDRTERLPDPASRFQPEGPHGSSEIVDPASYAWQDAGWRGIALEDAVLYEMHVGTFTREGTWAGALTRLPRLAELGITVVEMMPIADFPGRFGWGYDGVDLFAPTRLYGRPDDLRRFVDRAHALGIAVVLDVVYNHLGPDGNWLVEYAESYFSATHETEWGRAINFDGEQSAPVREFFLANAAYWIDEFHFDGLRLDATQSMFDESEPHILTAIAQRVRDAGRGRITLLIAENEPQDVRVFRPSSDGGHGLDAAWNDDFHHTAVVALTGRDEAYYGDYGGTPQELVSAITRGYLYQGQHYAWQRSRRGTPTRGIPPSRFVHYLQNHDQVANSLDGRRLHELTSPGRMRAMTALLLLPPPTPMLFQGQEFGASAPFLFFADHEPRLAARVRTGRAEFLEQFPSIAAPGMRDRLPRPDDPATFDRCRLDWAERDEHAGVMELHRDLLRLRRDDPVLRLRGRAGVEGAVLSDAAFVLRFVANTGDDRLLVVNLGAALHPARVPEPLLAPPAGAMWTTLWSSEDPRYGGRGTPEIETSEGRWLIPAEAAVLLGAQPGPPDAR